MDFNTRRSERLSRKEEIKIFEDIEILEKDLAGLYVGTFAAYEVISNLRRKMETEELSLEGIVRDTRDFLNSGLDHRDLYSAILDLERCLEPDGRIGYDVDFALNLADKLYALRLNTTHYATMTSVIKEKLSQMERSSEIIKIDFQKLGLNVDNFPDNTSQLTLDAVLRFCRKKNEGGSLSSASGRQETEELAKEILRHIQRKNELEKGADASLRSLSSAYALIRQQTLRLILVRKRLVFPYLFLVTDEAKKHEPAGYQLWDLIRVGTEGLVSAAESFYPKRCPRFSTLAYRKIRGSIARAIKDGDLIPSPVEDRDQEDW
jgi:hypothetical protein